MQETSGKRIQQQTTFWAERVLCGVVVYKKVCGFQPFVAFFPFHVIMAESSNVLVEHHKWAQLAITHVLGTHGSGAVLWQKHPLGFSSMFFRHMPP